MLRLASNLVKKAPVNVSSARCLSSTTILQAKAKSNAGAKPVKKKVTFDPKKFQQPQTKVKKSGMTHLEFHDAVRGMNFDKLASDLNSFEIENLTVESLGEPAKVVKYDEKTSEKLNSLGSFKKFQHHELFQKPVSLVSHNTVNINEQFISKLDGPSKDNRVCLVGERGSGKSTLVTQAKALALNKYNQDAILLHIDLAETLTNGSSSYIYNARTKKFQQPMFTKRWIYKVLEANENILKKLTLSQDVSFQNKRVDHHLKKGENTLYDFLSLNIDFGKQQPTTAFSFFVNELLHHSQDVPVIFSVDNINTIVDFPVTKYRHADFTPVHLSELEIGDFILKVAGGETNFAKGGVLLSKTGVLGHHQKTLSISLGLEEHDPYLNKKFFDLNIANALLANGGIKPLVVENLNKDETRELMEFWRESGVLFVKDYYTKESAKTIEDSSEEKPKHKDDHFDPELQFNRMVNNLYTVSTGNPHYLLKASAISF